jgi:predicted TIM-barrel fold metal-dependent hydrolase
VLFGSNGLDWTRYLREFHDLGIREERARAMLVDNARRVHGLD